MKTQIRPAIRIFLTLLGMLFVTGAFLGVLLLGTMTSRPTYRVAVAVRDLNVGERLQATDYRIVDQIIDPSLGKLYVQSQDVDAFLGHMIVDVIRRGDPLNKVKLTNGDADIPLTRYTLVLTNPNDVLMTLPVNPDVIPPKLVAGDTINILFIAGDESGTKRLPEAAADNMLLSATNEQVQALPTPADSGALPPTMEPTATPAVALPLADLMAQRVLVVDVTYQKLQNPNYGNAQSQLGDQPFIDGPISSIVVRVPREFQTLLGFGIATSKLRFAIASPLPSDNRPELGVDWNAYLQFYRWKQEQAAARGQTVNNVVFPGYTPITSTVPASLPAAATTP